MSAPSAGERAAWKMLRLLKHEGFDFRREHPIGPYRVDFVCLRRRIIVEIDGGVHKLPGVPERDAKRDAWLREEGFDVLRFSDREMFGEAWIDRVRAALNARSDASYRKKVSPPPLEGEGAGGGVSNKRQRSMTSPPPLTPPPSRGRGDIDEARPIIGEGETPFWKTKTLAQMSDAEWESLCDGCGKCCLIGLEDEDTGEIYLTDVACKLLDGQSCQCSDYPNRKAKVPDCVKLTPENVPELNWLPRTCAYRLVNEGRDLFWWHPLISGDPETVHAANVSVRGKTRPEGRLKIPGLMKRITKWPEPQNEPVEKPPPKRTKRNA